jgi:hypothetical protein
MTELGIRSSATRRRRPRASGDSSNKVSISTVVAQNEGEALIEALAAPVDSLTPRMLQAIENYKRLKSQKINF